MRPNLWRWVGIGMLVALGVAWLTEVWLTTRAPWRPWPDVQPPVAVAPARNVPPSPRPNPARGATAGGTVIVEHADGTAERVNVGPGQIVIVGTDGSIHVVTGSGSAAVEKRRAQAAEIQAQEAAIQAKMAAGQKAMEAAQQKAMAMGQGAVRIEKVAPPDGQAFAFPRPAPAVTNPDASGQTSQPSNADGAESSDAAPATPATQP